MAETNQQPVQNQVTTQNTTSVPPQSSAQSVPVANDAVSQDVARVKSLVQKLKEGIKQKQLQAKEEKEKVKASGEPTKPGLIKGNKTLMIALGVFLVLIILLVTASIYKSLTTGKKPVIKPTATPAIQQTATPSAITTPSKYATDSGVLDIEKRINQLDSDMNSTDTKEPQLTPPQLDFTINFKQ